MRRIYMDANATTPLLPEVVEAMRPWWTGDFGNASSIHQSGQRARAAIDRAREQVARLLNCRPAEVVFTSGGTESDNLALFGIMGGLLSSGNATHEGKAHLITTAIEHHAVLHAAEELARRGVQVTFLPCTAEGLIEPAALESALRANPAPRPNTTLVSVMLANNETGVIQPIRELAALAHAAGALFHTDAIQAAGKLPLDVNALGCDLLSLSGHKMYAPQGIGALFVRRNVRLRSMFFGGLHERGRRAGTENVAGIVGLGKAAELAQVWLAGQSAAKEGARNVNQLAALRDRLEQGILAAVEETTINGTRAPRVANTSNLCFDQVEAEALVIALDLKGLAISGGSACQSGATEPSHVLRAMGLSEPRARASVRFSLSRLTTLEEIDAALGWVPVAVARLRQLAPRNLASVGA